MFCLGLKYLSADIKTENILLKSRDEMLKIYGLINDHQIRRVQNMWGNMELTARMFVDAKVTGR